MARTNQSSGRTAIHRNNGVLFLLILTGIVLGSFLGHLASGVSALSWLDYGMNFGLSEPFKLDLGVIFITFGISIKITIGSIIGIVVAAILYNITFR